MKTIQSIKKITLVVLMLGTVNLFAYNVKIALAANVAYAIPKLKAEFKKDFPNTKVQVTLSSSGKLAAMIESGASYDIFMSANMKYPQRLYKDKLAVTKPVIYAQGALAYLSDKKQDFSKGIKLTLEKNIKKIALANPRTAPYGKASVEALKNGGVYKQVVKKCVYASSISSAVTYTLTAADLGFIAKSSLYSPGLKKFKKGINWMEVNPKLYTPISQGIVLLNQGKNNKNAKAFYKFILSSKAKKIFKDFGYKVP